MDIELILSKLLKKGLTQTQIASEIGCSQPTISEMANGKVGKARPSYKIVEGLKQLANRHGVSIGAEPESQISP